MDGSLRGIGSFALNPSPARALGRRWHLVLHLVLLASDLLLTLAGFAIAYWLRYRVRWSPPFDAIVQEVATVNDKDFRAFLPVALALTVVVAVLLETKGLYRLPRTAGFLDHAGIIVSSVITGIALVIVVAFFYRPFYHSRLIFAFAGATLIFLLCTWRALLLAGRAWIWQHGIGLERTLVVGATGLGKQVMQSLVERRGYSLIGYMDEAERELFAPPGEAQRYQRLGGLDDLSLVVGPCAIDQVILALPFWENHRLPALVQSCRQLGVPFRIVPDLYELSFDRVDVTNVSGVPLIGLKEVSLTGWNLLLKRALDLAVVLLSLPVTIPLSLLIMALVKLDSRGPALFPQVRVGRGGRLFTLYKFRTMVDNAEARKAELAALNEADGPLFKIRNDPRVTRVGRLLRRTSLDELPQLWNILSGEMSLVGPRPGLPDEVSRYEPWQIRRLEVSPGLTGLAQVLGRSDISWDEMVRLDVYYVENWTVEMDLRIILMTVPAVLAGRGAY
jgi:exopolysaccharide biosynthesis polyprenyl glycosylphosphotransferase